MSIPLLKFSPTSQLDFVASIQACDIILFAWNKWLLGPGAVLSHPVCRGCPCQYDVRGGWESWRAQSQGAAAKEHVYSKGMFSNHDSASKDVL